MEHVKYAVQYEPGRWRVYIARENFRQVHVMPALQFSRLLAGEPYETEVIFTEWEEDDVSQVIHDHARPLNAT